MENIVRYLTNLVDKITKARKIACVLRLQKEIENDTL